MQSETTNTDSSSQADARGALQRTAADAYAAGDFTRAVQAQVELVNQLTGAGEPNTRETKLLGLYLYAMGDYPGAAKVLRALEDRTADDPEVMENLGVVLARLGQLEDAAGKLLRAVALQPDSINAHDALARVYGDLERWDDCRHHGERALELKDDEAAAGGKAFAIPSQPPSAFRHDAAHEHVIAFSLFGTNPRYIEGGLRNLALAPDIYPGWTCRIYCDETVPAVARQRLGDNGAEIVMMARPDGFHEGLLWRFLAAGEPTVKRFLVRDIDSVINIKERVAVDAWLQSDRYFHVMRDHHAHTEVMHAGLWGGVGGVLPPLQDLLNAFKPASRLTRTLDQMFLRQMVWPTARHSCLIHDRLFGAFDAQPFPPYGSLPPGKHVGQNEWPSRRARDTT